MFPGNLRFTSTLRTIRQLQKKWNSDINLLFLDFDGVFLIPRKNKEIYLKRISKLCETYHLHAVITSTWRFNIDECEDILKPYQISIIGRTELKGNDRNIQIMNYLKTHPFHHFVILDDMFLESFQTYAVQTDFYHGFDEKAYDEAVKILETQIMEEL